MLKKLYSTLAVLVVFIGFSNVAIATPPQGDAVFFHSYTGGCWHVYGGGTNAKNGDAIVIHWDECQQAPERLRFRYSNNKIVHSLSGLCVTPEWIDNGYVGNNTTLVLRDCTANGEGEFQKFSFLSNGSILNSKTGKCIHPYGGGWNVPNNTPLKVYDGCGETRLQYHTIEVN